MADLESKGIAMESQSPKEIYDFRDSTTAHVETPSVDAATERRLIRALDIRIIPMCMWIYLMNMMDRGTSFIFKLCPALPGQSENKENERKQEKKNKEQSQFTS